MDPYVTGAMIRRLREKQGLNQQELADRLCVSGKAVSRWETGRGYPDLTLLESLARALNVSVAELLSGTDVTNTNPGGNMLRARFYRCPVCGNALFSAGEAVISCHGIALPPMEAEPCDERHPLKIEVSEDEYYVSIEHEMTREHFVVFLAALSDNGVQLARLYPEGAAEARFRISRVRRILVCCNRDGLFFLTPPRIGQKRSSGFSALPLK